MLVKLSSNERVQTSCSNFLGKVILRIEGTCPASRFHHIQTFPGQSRIIRPDCLWISVSSQAWNNSPAKIAFIKIARCILALMCGLALCRKHKIQFVGLGHFLKDPGRVPGGLRDSLQWKKNSRHEVQLEASSFMLSQPPAIEVQRLKRSWSLEIQKWCSLLALSKQGSFLVPAVSSREELFTRTHCH